MKAVNDQGPSAVVTGASRGIGLAITRHLGAQGWDVYATARSADDLSALGRMPNVQVVQLGITDRTAVARLPEHLPARLDGVVGNVGIIVQGPVETVPLADLSRRLEVNVIAPDNTNVS
jgi:NAD(P)-dependent dehydrogenase (short-subunit alcohol dehydrogenase family)